MQTDISLANVRRSKSNDKLLTLDDTITISRLKYGSRKVKKGGNKGLVDAGLRDVDTSLISVPIRLQASGGMSRKRDGLGSSGCHARLTEKQMAMYYLI